MILNKKYNLQYYKITYVFNTRANALTTELHDDF